MQDFVALRYRSARFALAASVALAVFLSAAIEAPLARAKPTAIVALGDSISSGEGAGNYDPGTNTPTDLCHRSQVAFVHQTNIPGIDTTINLACSGSIAANVWLGSVGLWLEPSQATKLLQIARQYDVKAISLDLGGNDIDIAEILSDCIGQYVSYSPIGCRNIDGPTLPARFAIMEPAVAHAMTDIRTVMRADGYPDSSYQTTLLSTPAAAQPPLQYPQWNHLARLINACPVSDADLVWSFGLTEKFASAMQSLAAAQGWRYLDLVHALDGHQPCARGMPSGQQWVNGIQYNPFQCWYCLSKVQESFHPNSTGHAQLGRCVTEFYALPSRNGACVVEADGDDHAVPLNQ